MKTTDGTTSTITILGAGSMGIRLARLYKDKGYAVTLWNRTFDKIAALSTEGINVTPSLAEAIASSPVILICVLDYAASFSLLSAAGADETLHGKTLVQLSTGSPEEAAQMGLWVSQHGGHYLAAALQVAPEQMGQPDTTILLSGKEEVFKNNEALLYAMGGNIKYLGEDITLASAMDMATLSAVYGTIIGFLHGANISAHYGFDVAAYGAIVAEMMPGFAAFLQHEARVIQSGDFSISQSPLSISVGATRRILEAAEISGINSEFPQLASGLLARAAKAGYEKEELAAVIKILRTKNG